MTKRKLRARGSHARGVLCAVIAMAFICSTAAADNMSAAFVFPFGDSLWSCAGFGSLPQRLKALNGASFARCWDLSGADVVAADTRSGRMLSLASGSEPGSEPKSLGSGTWSWAGAGAGLVAAASREYRRGFEFRVLSRASVNGGRIEGGILLDCFVSDALFLPGKLLVAGANQAGSSFSVWELAPRAAPGAATAKAKLADLPRESGFLRLTGAEDALYCFVSASSSSAPGSLKLWSLSSSGPREMAPRFISPLPIAWFGSATLDAKGFLEMPLSLGGGRFALSFVDPITAAEKARISLAAPLYQWLGSSKGIEYAILYDHAKAPGRFRFAEINVAERQISLFDMP